MSTEITLVPQAGLCNRINAIVSAFALCEARPDVRINIYWEKLKDCYANFDDLFQPIDTDRIKLYPLKKFSLCPARKRNLYIPFILRKSSYENQYNGGEIYNSPLEEWIDGKKNIYITSSNRFCVERKFDQIGKIFKPTAEIEKTIESVTSQYGEHTVGVHIRRTDNAAAIKNSPMEMYYKEMDEVLENEPQTKFYIASDDECVKSMIKKKYGNSIITHEWTLERNSVQGMKDAVAELYCLARTSKLIGSTNSTYSLVATRLYEIPILNSEIIQSVTDCTL